MEKLDHHDASPAVRDPAAAWMSREQTSLRWRIRSVTPPHVTCLDDLLRLRFVMKSMRDLPRRRRHAAASTRNPFSLVGAAWGLGGLDMATTAASRLEQGGADLVGGTESQRDLVEKSRGARAGR
ncbi:hypothetical protein PVAP13_4KG111200 [Panicum virgatum]|uniref:Uncharacterized protein n=1 Tax=Panicum virgatum TaxID=38727 RepID=A0A8T0TRP9_PANVG|nr:hypothetical protein PVAP13_4KG111200 [Panicum virgatum]